MYYIVLRFKNWTKSNCQRYRNATNCQQQTTAQWKRPLNLLLHIKPLSNWTQPFSTMRTASMPVTHRWTSNSMTMCLEKVEERNGGECMCVRVFFLCMCQCVFPFLCFYFPILILPFLCFYIISCGQVCSFYGTAPIKTDLFWCVCHWY